MKMTIPEFLTLLRKRHKVIIAGILCGLYVLLSLFLPPAHIRHFGTLLNALATGAGLFGIVIIYQALTGQNLFGNLAGKPPIMPQPNAWLGPLQEMVDAVRRTYPNGQWDTVEVGDILIGLYGHPMWDRYLKRIDTLARYEALAVCDDGVIVGVSRDWNGDASQTTIPWLVPWNCIAANMSKLYNSTAAWASLKGIPPSSIASYDAMLDKIKLLMIPKSNPIRGATRKPKPTPPSYEPSDPLGKAVRDLNEQGGKPILSWNPEAGVLTYLSTGETFQLKDPSEPPDTP